MLINSKLSLPLALVLTLFALFVIEFGPRAGATLAPNANEIVIRDFSFQPATLTVKAGTKVTWVNRELLSSSALASGAKRRGNFSFAQISDSHIGFNKDPNHEVTKTFQEAVDKINALEEQPAFVIHTGDISHLSRPEEFDTASQILKGVRASEVYFVPGEHDVFTNDGKLYLERFHRGTQGQGWQSFDYDGVHFVGLINVLNLKQGSGTWLRFVSD